MTNINIPLLTDVMVHVRRNPEQWNQQTWGTRASWCGTTHCIAGWAAHLSGAEVKWRRFDARRFDALSTTWSAAGVVWKSDTVEALVSVEDYGTRVLGLSEWQAHSLFYANEENVWPRIADITDGEITLEKIDAIIAEQDARHRSDDPERTGNDDEEENERDNEEPRLAVRELVSA